MKCLINLQITRVFIRIFNILRLLSSGVGTKRNILTFFTTFLPQYGEMEFMEIWRDFNFTKSVTNLLYIFNFNLRLNNVANTFKHYRTYSRGIIYQMGEKKQ